MFENDIDDNRLSLTRFNKSDKRLINLFSNKFENNIKNLEVNAARSNKTLSKKLAEKFQFAAIKAGAKLFCLSGKIATLITILHNVDMVAGMIYAGSECVDTVLFTLILSVMNNQDEVSKDDINKMLSTLIAGHKLAVKLQSEEYDAEEARYALDGIKEFESSINSIITPYKI